MQKPKGLWVAKCKPHHKHNTRTSIWCTGIGSMKVKDLKKFLESMPDELPIVFRVDGFELREVSEVERSFVRKKVVLK